MTYSRMRQVAVMAALAASIAGLGVPVAEAGQVQPAAANRFAAEPEALTPGLRAPAPRCSTDGLHNTVSCAEAVVNSQSADIRTYARKLEPGHCDKVVAEMYGHHFSGSVSAAQHWRQLPAVYRHAGQRTVPAGGLAFFAGGSSGHGHVMISIGGGRFMSTDIHGPRTVTRTTISEIERSWGLRYLGWSQPWFEINH